MMNYEPYDQNQRFAVRFHVGCPHAPDGWPAEANPLADGQDPSDGYVLRTGAELNTLRSKLHKQATKAWDDNDARELEEHKASHMHSLNEEADRVRALLDGSLADAVRGAKSHDELQSLRHRVPAGHKFRGK